MVVIKQMRSKYAIGEKNPITADPSPMKNFPILLPYANPLTAFAMLDSILVK